MFDIKLLDFFISIVSYHKSRLHLFLDLYVLNFITKVIYRITEYIKYLTQKTIRIYWTIQSIKRNAKQ